MQVVITGAAGFIGSNLAKRLLNKGYSVIGVDSLTNDSPLGIKEFRLKELEVFNKFEFIKLDILNDGILALLGKRKCDYFIHLASKDIYYHKDNACDQYSEFFKVNTLGTIRMYELAHSMGAKKFVATSTFSVYGNTKKQVLTEKKLLPDPISPHGASKIAMESALKYLHHHYKISCIVPRVFSVYGPNMPAHTAFYNMIASAINHTPLEMHGDFLHKTRDFIYIDDVVDFLEISLSKRVQYQVVNIASGNSVSLKEVLGLINQQTGDSAQPVHYADRSDLRNVIIDFVSADTKKAEKLFRYKAKTTIQEGISKTFKWYKENEQLLKHTHYKG